MTAVAGGARRGRRPGAPDTRAAILAAARTRFASEGYGGATIRSIATDAGVDAALVHHYFGTKDDLFLAALQLPIDPRDLLAPVVAGGPEGAGWTAPQAAGAAEGGGVILVVGSGFARSATSTSIVMLSVAGE